MSERATLRTLFLLLALSILSTVAVTSDIWGPTTAKALWFRASIFVALPIYVILLLEYPKLRPDLRNPLNLAVVTFALVNILAAIAGVNWTLSFWGTYERMGGVFQLLHLTLLYFYVLTMANAEPRLLKILTGLLVWIAGFASVYGICEVLGPRFVAPDTFLLREHRISSIFGNPIFFAGFLILPMALTIVCWLRSSTRVSKSVYEVLFALQFMALIMTGTRGALLGLAVGGSLAGVLIFLKDQRAPQRSKILWLALLVFSIAVPIIAFPQSLPSQVFRHLAQVQDASAKARVIIWRVAWRGFTHNPVLGVGPENFYTVFYKYFDRTIYNYISDYQSYFDKPHNQLLELLVTTGAIGFLAYGAILTLAVLGLWKGYKAGTLLWPEFVALVSGAAAYLVQNFVAFAGIQWIQSLPPRNVQGARRVQVPAFVLWGLLAVSAYGAYSIYGGAAEVMGKISEATAPKDIPKSIGLFESAARSPYAWDRAELATRYVDQLADADQVLNPEQFKVALDDATAVVEKTARQTANDPLLWLELASLYSQRSTLNRSPADPRTGQAIQRAMDLAPNWIEPLIYLSQYEASRGRYDEAIQLARRIVELLPQNGEASWNLASMYKLHNDQELATQTAWSAVEQGYRFKSGKEIMWLSDHYSDTQNYDHLVEVYKAALRVRPYDISLYRRLAETYAKLGEKQKAIAMAMEGAERDPADPGWRAFVRSLQ
jgi:O-antigen ligase